MWESHLPHPKSGPWPNEPGISIHRIKGRIPTANSGIKMVQGVRDVFELTDLEAGNQTLTENNDLGKLVLIGRGLNLDYFQVSLADALSL